MAGDNCYTFEAIAYFMVEKQKSLVKQDLLIRNLKKGVESAYEALFKTFYTELVIHANRYLYDMDASREIVQNLFVTIYEKRQSLNISSSLKSYLYRAVQNRCINYINAQKTKGKYTNYILNNTKNQDNPIEQNLNATELENALYNAIGELPPKCRMIFKMNRFEGVSNGEIAERLDLSKRTVETQITKALKLLRVKLLPYMEGAMLVLLSMFF